MRRLVSDAAARHEVCKTGLAHNDARSKNVETVTYQGNEILESTILAFPRTPRLSSMRRWNAGRPGKQESFYLKYLPTASHVHIMTSIISQSLVWMHGI